MIITITIIIITTTTIITTTIIITTIIIIFLKNYLKPICSVDHPGFNF